MSAIITRLISSKENIKTTSREEIAALTNIGADEGVFNKSEHLMIQNLLKLKNVIVKEIMTPRVVVKVAYENMYLEDFLKNKEFLSFSRIPVYSEHEENITGYVFSQAVLEKLAEDQHGLRLKDIKRNIVIVPYTIVLFELWEKLLEQKEHIALVVDEYGGLDGIVTMEDIIETLLGLEIVDETDTVIDMQELARKRWKNKQAKYQQYKELGKDTD